MFAAREGYTEIIQLLMDSGADVNLIKKVRYCDCLVSIMVPSKMKRASTIPVSMLWITVSFGNQVLYYIKVSIIWHI